jgi:hypothetical protein
LKIKIATAILTLITAAILTLAVFVPTIAIDQQDSSASHAYGRHGEVTIQLPTGVPTHPTCLRLVASDIDNSSTYGGRDNIIVSLWIPIYNNFVPVAAITDASVDAINYFKILYNNTPIWTPPLLPNIINVSSDVLQVWKQGDIIIANLTVPQTIKLPFDQMNGSAFQAFGNQTFSLPALTLTFRPIGMGFYYEESIQAVPHPPLSGYTVRLTSIQSPAWVQVQIPKWLGAGPFEVTGHICNHLTEKSTPPTM